MFDFKAVSDKLATLIEDYRHDDLDEPFSRIRSSEFINDENDEPPQNKVGSGFRIKLQDTDEDDENEDARAGVMTFEIRFYLSNKSDRHLEMLKLVVEVIRTIKDIAWTSSEPDNSQEFFPAFILEEKQKYAVVYFPNITINITI